jgi:hypothetical protein
MRNKTYFTSMLSSINLCVPFKNMDTERVSAGPSTNAVKEEFGDESI